jgi:orotate phosphoribosyltransferase
MTEPICWYPAPVTATSTLALFEETGAYLRGHFRLTSGLHSGEYLQCAKVLAYPAYAEYLGAQLAERLRTLLHGQSIDFVSAPAMGGLIIGHEVARAFGAPFFFTERDAATNEMTLRRGFEFKPGQRALVVEDVVTTGGSTKEVIKLIMNSGAEVLAAGSIIDRSNGSADVGVPRVALEQLDVITYNPDECPLCREGKPLVKPGSRRA